MSYVRMSRGSTLAATCRRIGLPSFAIVSLGIEAIYHPSVKVCVKGNQQNITQHFSRSQDVTTRDRQSERQLICLRRAFLASPARAPSAPARAVSGRTSRNYLSGHSTIPSTQSSTPGGLV